MAGSDERRRWDGDLESDRTISMPLDHFRWLLMWHTAMNRELLLIEIQRFSVAQARRNARKLDRQRKEFLQSLQEKRS
jgi:hypothetical protein